MILKALKCKKTEWFKADSNLDLANRQVMLLPNNTVSTGFF